MPTIAMVPPKKINHESIWLMRRQANVFSQSGEDGILGAIFETIGTRNKWCVEFGAWDGVHLSNTCNLIRNQGWSAVQIEGDTAKFPELVKNFEGNDKVRQINRMVGFTEGVDCLDDILATTPIPKDFDLLSIDIDGNDWHVWDSLNIYKPRVVVIEHNGSVPNDVIFIQDPDMSVNEGCSLAALIDLGKQKGYEFCAVTTPNAFFVRREDFPLLKIPDNSIDALRRSPIGRIFSGYNRKIYHTMSRMGWGGGELPADCFQKFPPEKQGFAGRVRRDKE
ncbi:MAG: hypothetical protein ACKVP5_01205 [Aestuariivirga sp.]